MKRSVLIFVLTSVCWNYGFAQNFYAIDTIQKIEITFTQSNWDYILDTAKQGSDTYTLAPLVKINGVIFDSVGVKYKGNSSYNQNNAKNPLHIELDHFKTQDYQGIKDIKLSNGYHEPSFVREVLGYAILQNYTEVSRANFAQVYINGQYWGVYTNVEAVTNTFLEDRFYSDNNTFVFADAGGCGLSYSGPDSTFYYTPYTMKSDYGWQDLANLCDSLQNNINGIENILNVDRTLWMLAVTNSMVILDSYLGNSKHNYYLYEDDNGRFNPIIWDLNGGFGVFSKINNGPGLTVSQLQNLTPMLHANDSMWPLVKNILAIPLYKRMYIAHMRTIMNENFLNNAYVTQAQNYQNIIDTAIQSDPNNFYTHAEFLSNMSNTVVDGVKTIPGVTELMNARTSYLYSTTEFQQVPPVISAVNPSNSFPTLNSSIYFTASVSNANAVYLGIRNTVSDRFFRYAMLDDGLNGDGAAGDGVYGISFAINSPQVQYFIYAENANAGIFSPERAEHEYYTLNSNYMTVSAGQVVINEVMAANGSVITNANGDYSDWIELFNPSANAVSLDYMYLSDSETNLAKWQFPNGTVVQPGQFLIIWADEDTSSVELHANFKLSAGGEKVILSYLNGTIIDSVHFPGQVTDFTWGRFPNGTGPFQYMPATYNTYNSLVGIEEASGSDKNVLLFPNPSSGSVIVQLPNEGLENCEICFYDLPGRLVCRKKVQAKNESLELSLPAGVYFYRIRNGNAEFGKGKLCIQH
jgi:hypothetical protein